MPNKPLTICNWPGCRSTCKSRFCDPHVTAYKQRQAEIKDNDPRRQFYSSKQWREKRHLYLLANPWCVICGRWANNVDHITALSDGGLDEPSNYQSLCHSHHSKKTASESKAFTDYNKGIMRD